MSASHAGTVPPRSARQSRWLRRLRRAGGLLTGAFALFSALAQTAPPPPDPKLAEVRATRTFLTPPPTVAPLPPSADPLQGIVVIEGGPEPAVHWFDGDTLQPLRRIPSRRVLSTEARLSPDGLLLFAAAPDGWITSFDLRRGTARAEVRAGLGPLNLASSRDGRWLLAGNETPHTLVLFDTELQAARVYPAATRDGQRSSAVAAVHDAPPRRSFIVALRDLPEIWEISYDPRAEDIYEGLVHDFRMGEGLPVRGFLYPRRTLLAEPVQALGFDLQFINVLGRTRGGDAVQVVNPDVRRRVATLAGAWQPSAAGAGSVQGSGAGQPHPAGAAAFEWQGRNVLAVPNLQRAGLALFDTGNWQLLREIPTAGPVAQLHSDRRGRHLWATAPAGAAADDTLTVIDQRSLEVVATLREPGRQLRAAAFTRDGRQLLALVEGVDGALIAYDTATLAERRRLPLRAPQAVFTVESAVGSATGPPR